MLLQITSGLREYYPDIKCHLNFCNPWQLLVATVLSAQCTDARVNQITPEFFRLWPSPLMLAKADLKDIEQVIHSSGLFRSKAKNLLACAKKLADKYNGEVPCNMEDLIKLPGVARKTANVVLFGAFGQSSGIAVDTHVKRISFRLGLTNNIEPLKIEKDLMKLFPQDEWGLLNIRMVQFGRDICRARNPQCTDCKFNHFCPQLDPKLDAKKRTGKEQL